MTFKKPMSFVFFCCPLRGKINVSTVAYTVLLVCETNAQQCKSAYLMDEDTLAWLSNAGHIYFFFI